MKNESNLWSNEPKRIMECSVDQIIYILSIDILNNVNKLKEHKLDIINYIRKNKFDGNKLVNLQRKPFIAAISQYLDNKKLSGAIGQLYNKIIKYDLSKVMPKTLTSEKQEEIKENTNNETADTNVDKNSKFVTSDTSYYSFGRQYRYTKNFSKHPLYISPKYQTLKQEIVEYFKTKNHIHDIAILMGIQVETITSMSPSLQPMLLNLINGDLDNMVVDDLIWNVNGNDDEKMELLTIIELEEVNNNALNQIINRLFAEGAINVYTACSFIK
eukprot:345096_1